MFGLKKQKELEARLTNIEEAQAEAAKLKKQKNCSHRWMYNNEYNSHDRTRSATKWTKRCRCCGLFQLTTEFDVIKDLCARNGYVQNLVAAKQEIDLSSWGLTNIKRPGDI